MATDGSGNVYVADTANHRIQKFDPSGTFLWDYPIHPEALATDGSGNLYVIAKVADDRPYLVLDREVRPQRRPRSCLVPTRRPLPTRGPRPSGVATDGSGNVYVAETGNHRIQKFDARGHLPRHSGGIRLGRRAVQRPDRRGDGRRPGNVYVADTGNNRIQKFACP